ncbi:MAG TPA: hypothetical protein VJG67_02780 [Candidatus Paceibacterota bacterium]
MKSTLLTAKEIAELIDEKYPADSRKANKLPRILTDEIEAAGYTDPSAVEIVRSEVSRELREIRTRSI